MAKAMPEGSPQEEGQESSAEEGQEQAQGQGDQGGGVSDLIAQTGAGLDKVASLVQKAKGVDPSAAKAIMQAADMFRSAIQSLVGGKGGMGPQQMQGGSSMEAGGNPNVQQAY